MFSYSAETSHSIYPFTVSTQPPPDSLTPPAGSRLPNVRPVRNVKVFFAGVHARTHAPTHVIIVFAILHFAVSFLLPLP